MSVKKIFMTLIVIVICLIIGGFLINVLVPNAAKQLVNAGEGQIYRATGFSFDFNNDGIAGQKGSNGVYTDKEAGKNSNAATSNGGKNVAGFDTTKSK